MGKLRQLLITLGVLLVFGGCSRYDYTLRKPVVKFQTPSKKALSSMLRESNNKRYRWAEEGPHSFDCSGFVYYNYGSMNLWLPRRAIEQARYGKTIPMSQLRYGDLIFFDTRKYSRGKINHVGIYIGKNRFRHASSRKKRIITTSLNKAYYKKRVVICKRVIPQKKYKKPFKIVAKAPKPVPIAKVKEIEEPVLSEQNNSIYIDRPLIGIDESTIEETLKEEPKKEPKESVMGSPESFISKPIVQEANSTKHTNLY